MERTAPPLHEQVRNVLIHSIESGEFPDGKLPSETQLCERFDVSRITVRRAVSDLESMGVVTRQQGRGTFVVQRPVSLGTMSVQGFSDQLVGSATPTRRIVGSEVFDADQAAADVFGVAVGSPMFRLIRVFSIDRLPVGIDDSTYSLDRYPGFDQRVGDETSTYQVLRDEYGARIAKVERVIGIAYTDKQTAEWLERPDNDPIILIEKVAWDESGTVVHTSRVRSVPSRMTLRTVAVQPASQT
ncbi:GntR family transcriptional regulator [Leifsonia sp. NPDC058292]|uniref:GntR family transcriptional regulator n=1 Tax=Leifsonia sp. NPDC058292 TaxID=3346428 RepID=UPI0036DD2533